MNFLGLKEKNDKDYQNNSKELYEHLATKYKSNLPKDYLSLKDKLLKSAFVVIDY